MKTMSGFKPNDTMPKLGHVTDLREQWLVRTDGALAHRLQDREISSHLCENRYRNQQIREDFPVALSEQQDLEHEARIRELARLRQAEIDAEIAREMAEINLRRQRRKHSADLIQQPSCSRAGPMVPPPEPAPLTPTDIIPEELGLSPVELDEMRRRLEQEEQDARLARALSHESQDQDVFMADMRCAVEAQDGELARLLQEREYKKLQRAKEKARQKALLKKQQRIAQHQKEKSEHPTPNATLCDAYSNPRDMIRDSALRLCKSVDSDLNYIEPFEKEHIQSKASALQAKEMSRKYYPQNSEPGMSSTNVSHGHTTSYDSQSHMQGTSSLQHRELPPLPLLGKKPRFPDPVSIRPASHYPADPLPNDVIMPHSISENNNLYSSTYPPENASSHANGDSKRLSVISEISAEGLAKRKNKQDKEKKKKGCKIQ